MSKAQKPWHTSIKTSKAATNPDRVAPKNVGNPRTKATIKRLNMYRTRAVRDKRGKVIHEEFHSKELPSNTRIQPDRRWFQPTRQVGQKQLEQFREEITKVSSNPYMFLMKKRKLPMGLLTDTAKVKQMHLLEVETFASTFGPKSTRKKPKVQSLDYDSLLKVAETKASTYSSEKDSNIKLLEDMKNEARLSMFDKGQSKRIWGELFKVIDSSDVIVQVLDARDPMGTRSQYIEQHIRKNFAHKHIVLVLNKCDLVPVWATVRWVQVLSKEFPTLAFHASVNNSFGKGALIQLLRQFSHLHTDKKNISVGFIGYPNVGKSSVINTLRAKKVCKVAPIPGETKVWQYITLMRRIFLIDCPGVVYDTGDTETDIVLKGVVRVENLPTPADYIPKVLEEVRPLYIKRTYEVSTWKDTEDFLTKLAIRSGKLLKGGEPDLDTVAKMVLYDWQRGKLPWFMPPPLREGEQQIKAEPELKVKEEQCGTSYLEPTEPERANVLDSFRHLLIPSKEEIEGQTEDDDGKSEQDSEEEEYELKADQQQDEALHPAHVKQIFKNMRIKSDFWTEEDQAPPEGYEDLQDVTNVDAYDWDQVLESVVGEDEIPFDPNERDASDEIIEEENARNTNKGNDLTDSGVHETLSKDEDEDEDEERPAESDDEEMEEGEEIGARERVGKTRKITQGRTKHKKRKRTIEEEEVETKRKKTIKEPRMTTNKRKIGTHFYCTHNVKNRSRGH